jgi:integrase
MLRPSELCNLDVSCVLLSEATLDTQGAISLVIVKHKTKRTSKLAAHVRFIDVALEASLRKFFLCKSSFGLTPASLRSGLKRILSILGIQPGLFSPAGLRAGGALERERQGMTHDMLQFLGRWSTQNVLRHYLRSGALAIVSGWCPTLKAKISRFSDSFEDSVCEFLSC